MKPTDFVVDPLYLIPPELLTLLTALVGGLLLVLCLRTVIRNGRPGVRLARFTFLDVIRTRLYWVIVGCALVTSLGLVLILFLKAYPEIRDEEQMSGIQLATNMFLMSDSPENLPVPVDEEARVRDLLEGMTLFVSLLLQAIYVFFGSLLAIFVGMGLLSNELERRSIYTLISKPLDRMMIFLGKLGGAYLALALYAVVLWALDALLLAIFGVGVRLNILPAFLVASFVPLLLAALTLYFSTIAKSLVAGFWAIVLMFASNNMGAGVVAFIFKNLLRLEDREIDWVFLLLPPQRYVGLYSLNFLIEDPLTRFFVTRTFPLTNDPAIMQYPILYFSILMLLAYWSFSRKEFN